jgi:hypothetical protein
MILRYYDDEYYPNRHTRFPTLDRVRVWGTILTVGLGLIYSVISIISFSSLYM